MTKNEKTGFGKKVYPELRDIETLLRRWVSARPERIRVSAAGTSAEGRPILAVRVSDYSVGEEDKQHVLLTALHSGVERSGTVSVLAILEWLLSDDERAREIRRRQVVVAVPVPDPDNYLHGRHGPVYNRWNQEGPIDPGTMPEGVAMRRLMDELQPEVHADIHGMSMDFAEYTMLENSACSYSNHSLKPYHRDIVKWMDDAALAEGYPSDLQEDDSELLLWGPGLSAIENRLWRGRAGFYAAIYPYTHFHTMPVTSEVCWAQSGVARHRALFELGNQCRPGEPDPGYPVNVIASNDYHMIVATGADAETRRHRRVTLWQQRDLLSYGMPDPMVEGSILFLCATSPRRAAPFLSDNRLETFQNHLSEMKGVHAPPIRQFLEGWPAGQNAPYPQMAVRRSPVPDPDRELCCEFGIRLRIFDDQAEVKRLLINGKSPEEFGVQHTRIWTARGMTYIQMDIPAESAAEADLIIATCEYSPGRQRSHWDIARALACAEHGGQ